MRNLELRVMIFQIESPVVKIITSETDVTSHTLQSRQCRGGCMFELPGDDASEPDSTTTAQDTVSIFGGLIFLCYKKSPDGCSL